MKLEPESIIDIIQEEFNIDIRENTKKREHSDLRAIYYYLAQKYCGFNTLDYIAQKVNRKHSNAYQMTERLVERLKLQGYKHLKVQTSHLSNIIYIFLWCFIKCIKPNIICF